MGRKESNQTNKTLWLYAATAKMASLNFLRRLVSAHSLFAIIGSNVLIQLLVFIVYIHVSLSSLANCFESYLVVPPLSPPPPPPPPFFWAPKTHV